jgi:hypothetical protein
MTTPHGPGSLSLDGAMVRARRLELGLSDRTFTAMLGTAFSQTIVRSIEAGNAWRDLTLADIERVADVLSLSAADVVVYINPGAEVRDTEPWVSGEQRPRQDSQVAQLGRVLHRLAAPVPEEALATALRLTMSELDEALDILHVLLALTGLEVRSTGGFVSLGAGPTGVDTAGAVQALARQQVARNGLNVSQVLMVFRVVVGEKLTRTLGNAERLTKGALLNAGLLEQNTSGGLRATSDVRFSLMLDWPPQRDGSRRHQARVVEAGPDLQPGPVLHHLGHGLGLRASLTRRLGWTRLSGRRPRCEG